MAKVAKPQLAKSLMNQGTVAQENTPIEEDAAPRAVLVVMQGEQYGQPGSMQWTICVWRVMVWDSAHAPVQKGTPAKSI